MKPGFWPPRRISSRRFIPVSLAGHPQPTQMDTKVKRMTIHAERVGEYTLNTCG